MLQTLINYYNNIIKKKHNIKYIKNNINMYIYVNEINHKI